MRYVDQPQYRRVTWQQIKDSARQAAERAVALDPTLADSQIAVGKYYVAAAWDWDAAAPYLERARRLDPADPWPLCHQSRPNPRRSRTAPGRSES
jgi:tetratricopeptide (TPR) repeat protein